MRCSVSARLIPAEAMRISTSPAFGSGTGRVPGTSTSGPPGDLISMTVWVAGMLASIALPLGLRWGRISIRARDGRTHMPLLQDKVALVTGAGAGIGRAIALGMAAEGATVAAADIDLAAAQKTVAAMNSNRALAIEADCGDVASIDAMIERTVAEFGRLDVIVNNAGVTRYAYVMDLTEADWDRIHRVNAKGVFFCLQRAAKQMIEQKTGGRIINMASISGRGYAGASNAAYAASKGAVIALTKMAAQQLGRYDINVNAICPGVTRTELGQRNAVARAASRGITIAEMQAEQEAGIPIGRANTPDDIAAMAVFLASPGARNITGQSYNVDGGLVNS